MAIRDRQLSIVYTSLRRRFIFMGIINAIAVPFIVPYILIHSFFRYFEVRESFHNLSGGSSFFDVRNIIKTPHH